MMHGTIFWGRKWTFSSGHWGTGQQLLPNLLCQEMDLLLYRGFCVRGSIYVLDLDLFPILKLKNI